MEAQTKKQRNDIECIKYFIPSNCKYPPITEKDEEMFLGWSERGLHKEMESEYKMDGFNALVQGKRWRGIHIHEMWEPGVLDGIISYWDLLGGYDSKEIMPRVVVDFMKKEMFKGKDAKVIEKDYQEVLNKWTSLKQKYN